MYFTYPSLPGYTIASGTDVLGSTSLASTFDFAYLDTRAGHDTFLALLNDQAGPSPTGDLEEVIQYYPAAGGTPLVRTHTVAAMSEGVVRVRDEGLPVGTYSAVVTLYQRGHAGDASFLGQGLVERLLYLKDVPGTNFGTNYTGAATEVGVSQPQTAWSFAAGYVSPTFHDQLVLANPSPTQAASGTVTFYRSDGTSATAPINLPAGGQQFINVASVLHVVGSASVNYSAQVSASQSILASRVEIFQYNRYQGVSEVPGTQGPGQLFEFSEGITGNGFDEWVSLANPSSQAATVTVRYLPNGRPELDRVYVVGPHQMTVINANQLMAPGVGFSMEVLASQPIVAERRMYFNYIWSGYGNQWGGTDVVGYQPPGSYLPPGS
jgi:hypothetical protein